MKQIKFALFSDFHYNEGRYISSVADLEAILKRANDAGVDFVLQAGDFCNNFPTSPEIFKTFLENEYGRPQRSPVYVSVTACRVVTPYRVIIRTSFSGLRRHPDPSVPARDP